MANFIGNIRNSFAGTEVHEADRGDLVQTIVITALFAVAAILVIGWLTSTIMAKGADVVECIEGSNVYTNKTNDKAACDEDRTTANKTDREGSKGWSDRFVKK